MALRVRYQHLCVRGGESEAREQTRLPEATEAPGAGGGTADVGPQTTSSSRGATTSPAMAPSLGPIIKLIM